MKTKIKKTEKPNSYYAGLSGYGDDVENVVIMLECVCECGDDETNAELLAESYLDGDTAPIWFSCWNCGNEEWLAIPEQEKENIKKIFSDVQKEKIETMLKNDLCLSCERNSISCECEE